MKYILALAFALALTLTLDSCLTPKVDQLALFEPAQLAWSSVAQDVEFGLVDGLEHGDLEPTGADSLRVWLIDVGLAIKTKNRDDLRMSSWPLLKPWATRGIQAQADAGSIGPGVADSFREHLSNFDQIMTKLRGSIP